MTDPSQVWVFDTGPLRHFTVNGWLRTIKFLADSNHASVIIPESVASEISDQQHSIPELSQILVSPWIRVDRSTDIAVSSAFARYEERLAKGSKNRGECGVLALGKAYGYTLILDDEAPRLIGQSEGMDVRVTLQLLCDAIRQRQLSVKMVDDLADDLVEGKYFLPIERGGVPSVGPGRRWPRLG